MLEKEKEMEELKYVPMNKEIELLHLMLLGELMVQDWLVIQQKTRQLQILPIPFSM
jgi:hypothetical protein